MSCGVGRCIFAEIIYDEEKIRALYTFETLCLDDLLRKKNEKKVASRGELLQHTFDM